MKNMIPLTVCAFIVLLIPRPAAAEQVVAEPFSPYFGFSYGLGFIQTAGGIATVWTDGVEGEFSVFYQFLSILGIEVTGMAGFTGITDLMSSTVSVVDSYGNISTESNTGGAYLGILFGPQFSLPISTSRDSAVVLTFGGGSFDYGEMDTGIDAVGYYNRWTFGWGGYASVGVRFKNLDSEVSWGIQLRYLYSYANVNDFHYDRDYTDDQRIILSVNVVVGA